MTVSRLEAAVVSWDVCDFTLLDDVCDCICELDVLYTLTGVPPGIWALVVTPSGVTTGVTLR